MSAERSRRSWTIFTSGVRALLTVRVCEEAPPRENVDVEPGGPEREAALTSMVNAMSNMNTVLNNRLTARNIEVSVCFLCFVPERCQR
jgi:hypothetical protein